MRNHNTHNSTIVINLSHCANHCVMHCIHHLWCLQSLSIWALLPLFYKFKKTRVQHQPVWYSKSEWQDVAEQWKLFCFIAEMRFSIFFNFFFFLLGQCTERNLSPDFRTMARLVATVQGWWLVSSYRCPETQQAWVIGFMMGSDSGVYCKLALVFSGWPLWVVPRGFLF